MRRGKRPAGQKFVFCELCPFAPSPASMLLDLPRMKLSTDALLPFLVLAVVACGSLSARAQRVVPDPVRDFLGRGDLGRRSEVEMNSAVLKMSIDLAGHGKPCVFLALPHSYVKGGGYYWDVYVPVRDGYVEALPGENESAVTCYPDRLYVGPVSEVGVRRGLVTFTISHGSGGIDAYWLKGRKVAHRKIRAFPFPEEAGNPDGSITTVPMLLKYFPSLARPYTEGKDWSQQVSFDDLRARGYPIPRAREE